MKAKEKIAALQALMKKEGIDGYLIPSSDPHMSEYLPDHYAARSWFSGFNGSAGTLAVTSEKAALWPTAAILSRQSISWREAASSL